MKKTIKIKEFVEDSVVADWIKRNRNFLSKELLISQAQNRFGCSKERALQILSSLKEVKKFSQIIKEIENGNHQ